MLIHTTSRGCIRDGSETLQEGLNLRGTVRGRIDPETLEVRPLPSQDVDWQGASDRDGAFLHGNAALWRVQNGWLLYAMPDLAGIHDVFYAPADEGGWLFADNFLEIARRKNGRRLDMDAVDYFIRHGYYRRGKTCFRDIHRVPVGQRVGPAPGRLRFERLFESCYAATQTSPRTYEGFKRILASVCRVEHPGRSDAILLSGGWDSALLAALLKHISDTGAPQSVTFRYRPDKTGNLADVGIARRLAQALDLRHHEVDVDFEKLAVSLLDPLIERMPLAAHLAFNLLAGVGDLGRHGIRSVWCGQNADAIYNLGPTARLGPGQGKIDLVKRWYLSQPFFESLPDVEGRAKLGARLATTCGSMLAGLHYRRRSLRAPANVPELVAAFRESEHYLALLPATVRRQPCLSTPVPVRVVREMLFDEKLNGYLVGRDALVVHHAPAMYDLNPIRPFAAPSLTLFFRSFPLTWRDVWSPKRYIRRFLAELFGERRYRALYGQRKAFRWRSGGDAASWSDAMQQTRPMREMRDWIGGLPASWQSKARKGNLQDQVSLFWLARTLWNLEHPLEERPD